LLPHRAAHAVVPITAIEQEWSLFSRDLEAGGHSFHSCNLKAFLGLWLYFCNHANALVAC
jgi:hypothetical protein